MVKVIRWDTDNYRWERSHWFWNRQRPIKHYGIELVGEGEEPDLGICASTKPLPEYLAHIPWVLENHNDQTSIPPKMYDILRLPQVVMCARNQTFRWPHYHIRATEQDEYYGHVWLNRDQRDLPPDRSHHRPWETIYDKIRIVFPLWPPPAEQAFQVTQDFPRLRDRPIDIAFMGRLFYSVPPAWRQRMRERLLMMWNRLTGT